MAYDLIVLACGTVGGLGMISMFERLKEVTGDTVK
jgi:hypothetical protein